MYTTRVPSHFSLTLWLSLNFLFRSWIACKLELISDPRWHKIIYEKSYIQCLILIGKVYVYILEAFVWILMTPSGQKLGNRIFREQNGLKEQSYKRRKNYFLAKHLSTKVSGSEIPHIRRINLKKTKGHITLKK